MCLAFLAKLPCVGCNYSHERHDVSTLDDDELVLIVQRKLQEIQSWNTRTQQWFLSPAPASPPPFGFVPSPAPYGHPLPYSTKEQEHAKNTSSFANTDPSKVVEFRPRGLQLPTPTSPKNQESLYNAPNEDPAVYPVESTQGNAATAGWENVSNGDGWFTPESNPGINTKDKKLEEYAEGKESEAKLDWAEDADRYLPISPLSWNDAPPTVGLQKGKGKAVTEKAAKPTAEWDSEPPGGYCSWDEPNAIAESEANEEKPVEVTKDMTDAWTAEYGWSMGTDDAATGWDNPPKVSYWDTPPGNEKCDAGGANEDNWNPVHSKGKKASASKEKSPRSPPPTPKPKNKDKGFYKGPAEKDRKTWGNGWKEEGIIKSTTPWDGNKKGKKGGKPLPKLTTAKPAAITDKKIGPMKEKGWGQAAGPKDAFTFNRITSSAATPQITKSDQEEDILKPDPDSLPELPPDLKDAGYSPEMEMKLRQAVVPKRKMPNRPSVAPLPENTTSDKGTSWVNGTLETGWNTEPLMAISKHKDVQKNDTNGWDSARVKHKASSSTATEDKMKDWPKLGE